MVRVDRSGDFSMYALRLVASAADPSGGPPVGIDPALSAAQFSFKAACDTDFDCGSVPACPPPSLDEPVLDYLAKDFPSINQLMLDRMSVTVPGGPAQPSRCHGHAHRSALLRRRLPELPAGRRGQRGVPRHRPAARFRAPPRQASELPHARWMQRQGVGPHPGDRRPHAARAYHAAHHGRGAPAADRAQVRGPRRRAQRPGDRLRDHELPPLYADHDSMDFYTWDALQCCLPSGATSATLSGAYPQLSPGDVLILAEVAGPQTGMAEDADPARRWPVMLIEVAVGNDPLHDQPVTSICWGAPDALPFPLTVNRATAEGDSQRIAAAYGNIVLADHGQSLPPELLPPVPEPTLATVAAPGADPCSPPAPVPVPARYSPQLASGPVTQAAPLLSAPAAVPPAGCPPQPLSAAAVFAQAVIDATRRSRSPVRRHGLDLPPGPAFQRAGGQRFRRRGRRPRRHDAPLRRREHARRPAPRRH